MQAALCACLWTSMMVCAVGDKPVRGAWVTAWGAGLHTSKQLDDTMEAASKAGLNVLLVQVRKVADAYYRSDLEPLGDNVEPGFDPLGAAIERGHKKGIRGHAWINALRVWRDKKPPANPNHVVLKHPEWLNRRVDGSLRTDEGQYLDPGIPEVREYVAAVAEDIARRYPVDGIHLDYIRYPGPDWGYSELALQRYRAETGAIGTPKPSDTKWQSWRREQVTQLVRLIRKKVKAVRPAAVLSAATISWMDCPRDFRSSSPYRQVYQDWRLWLAQGLLDLNVPMNYRIETNPKSAQQFRDWLTGYKRWSSGKPTYVGIGAHNNTTSDVLKQIADVEKAGMAGWMIFQFDDTPGRAALVKALSANRGR